jgi:hypothetical protein
MLIEELFLCGNDLTLTAEFYQPLCHLLGG